MKPFILKSEAERKGVSSQVSGEYAAKLSCMINCKTVFTRENENRAEFERFYAVLLLNLQKELTLDLLHRLQVTLK